MSKTVEEYLSKHPEYNKELTLLRTILNNTELEETVKWGIPNYTIKGKNVVGIGAFKSYVGLWFYNGSFLTDKHKVLINAQEGKTKGMRQWRFENISDIDEKLITQYVLEAIENQNQGKEIKPEKKPVVIPDELKEALSKNSQLSEAFDKLTPGKQKEYGEYIAEAKRSETRQKRLDKIIPMIQLGVGLNDKYK
ncbi:MAG: YdeI/OmpD-associated family protein [Marinoscillum sp.]